MTTTLRKPTFEILVGVFISVTVIVFANVQIRFNEIDLSEMTTVPNMAPEVSYFFIPVLFLPVALFALIMNSIVLSRKKIKLTGVKATYIGMCYGLILSFSTFMHLGTPLILNFVLPIILTFLSVHLVTEKFGEKTL